MNGKPSRVQTLTSWGLLFSVLVLIAITLGLHEKRDADSAIIEYMVIEKQKGSPMTSNWVSGGEAKSLTTPRRGDEAYDDWFNRHDLELAAAKARYIED